MRLTRLFKVLTHVEPYGDQWMVSQQSVIRAFFYDWRRYGLSAAWFNFRISMNDADYHAE